MSSILCIEDSLEIRLILRQILSPQHEFIQSSTLQQAGEVLSARAVDLIILDIELPDGDGLRFCSQLKTNSVFKNIPVVILSGNHSIQEKTIGFELGIEDFIAKPFEPIELKLRIEAKLRKHENKKSELTHFYFGHLQVDLVNQRVVREDTGKSVPVNLSPTEFKIFSFLIRHPEQLKSREKIISVMGGENLNISDRTVDTHVCRLRKKVAGSGCFIEAVSGIGYRLALDPNFANKAA